MASIVKTSNGRYRARYRDRSGKLHERRFARKGDAQTWIDQETTRMVTGTYIDPRDRKVTIAEWAERWIAGYRGHRPGTVRQAESHLRRIVAAFGDHPLDAVKPSDVREWMEGLRREGLADSTRSALHSRLAHLYSDAIHDGLVTRAPTSRRTSPPGGKQRPYVATEEQVWQLHDAMPAPMRGAILLGAFAGLRAGEIVALRTRDVDFMRGIITPRVQYTERIGFDAPLKTSTSATPIPIPAALALELARVPRDHGTDHLVVSMLGEPIQPSRLDHHFRRARESVAGLPAGFRLHDLRHYFASYLIAAGLDVKVVQARLRHASATVTLNTYGHLMPDRDDATRDAIGEAFARRAASQG